MPAALRLPRVLPGRLAPAPSGGDRNDREQGDLEDLDELSPAGVRSPSSLLELGELVRDFDVQIVGHGPPPQPLVELSSR